MDDRFLSVVAATLKIPKEKLSRDSNSESIPAWDSLMHWEIIAAIEKEYGTEFTMDEAVEFKTLGDIYDDLQQKGLL